MIALDRAAPESVCVAGVAYPVHTDYRDWVNFETLIFDRQVSDEEKVLLFLRWYKDDVPPDTVAAIKGLLWFYLCGRDMEKAAKGKKARRVSDLRHDAPYIQASFVHAYQIDLTRTDLHWWTFRTLLENLPDGCKYEQILGYRAVDIGKVAKDQRAQYRRLKAAYALPGEKLHETLEDRNRKWLDYADKINSATGAEMDNLPPLPEQADDEQLRDYRRVRGSMD